MAPYTKIWPPVFTMNTLAPALPTVKQYVLHFLSDFFSTLLDFDDEESMLPFSQSNGYSKFLI